MMTSGVIATMGRTTPVGVVFNAHWKQLTPSAGPARPFNNTHGQALRQRSAGEALSAPAISALAVECAFPMAAKQSRQKFASVPPSSLAVRLPHTAEIENSTVVRNAANMAAVFTRRAALLSRLEASHFPTFRLPYRTIDLLHDDGQSLRARTVPSPA